MKRQHFSLLVFKQLFSNVCYKLYFYITMANMHPHIQNHSRPHTHLHTSINTDPYIYAITYLNICICYICICICIAGRNKAASFHILTTFSYLMSFKPSRKIIYHHASPMLLTNSVYMIVKFQVIDNIRTQRG